MIGPSAEGVTLRNGLSAGTTRIVALLISVRVVNDTTRVLLFPATISSANLVGTQAIVGAAKAEGATRIARAVAAIKQVLNSSPKLF